jgi:hypothetical protein
VGNVQLVIGNDLPHFDVKPIGAELEAQSRPTRVLKEFTGRMFQEAELADGLIRFRPNLLDVVVGAGMGVRARDFVSMNGSLGIEAACSHGIALFVRIPPPPP